MRSIFQFRLTTVFALTAVVAVFVWQYGRLAGPVGRLKSAGATLLTTSEFSYDSGGNVAIQVEGHQADTSEVRMEDIRGVIAGAATDDRALLRSVVHLPNLELLHLEDADLTDDDMKVLAGLKTVKWLDVSGTHITDVGLFHLVDMESLDTLVVCRTAVTSNGIVRFLKKRSHVNVVRHFH